MDKQEEVRIDGIFDTFCVDKSVIKSDRSDKSGNFLEFKLNQRKKWQFFRTFNSSHTQKK